MINEPHDQPDSSQMESLHDERCGEWKNDDRSGDKKTLRRVVVEETLRTGKSSGQILEGFL